MIEENRILIIHHGQGIGGGLIALLALIDELKDRNIVKVLAIFDGIAVDYLRKAGVEVIVPKSKFYNFYYSLFIHTEADYFGIIQQVLKFKALITFFFNKYYFAPKYLKGMLNEIDIVYLNSTFICEWAFAVKKNKKKVIIHVREPLSNGYFGKKIITDNINMYCDKIIAITDDNAKRLNLPLKTEVVYDPIYKKITVEKENDKNFFNCSTEFKYFIYVGGESRIKGFQQLVNSLEFLDSNIRIFFLGGKLTFNKNFFKSFIRIIFNPYYLKHRKLVAKLKLSINIVNVGLTDDVLDYYECSQFLISPFSKPHASLPVLEAFSLGLPVIVSDTASMNEFLDEKNSITFQNKNFIMLADCINFAARISDQQYKELQKNVILTYNQLRRNEKSVQLIIDTL